MSSTTTFFPVLEHRLQTLAQAITQSLTWVHETRLHAPRLDLEAPRLNLNLYRYRLQLDRLAQALVKRRELGLYGRDHSAKTQLIKVLIAGSDDLPCTFAGKTLDYLTHIRPLHAAVGCVIRFSYLAPPAESDYPVQLTLLTEGELVALLARAGQADHMLDIKKSRDLFAALASQCQPKIIAGLRAEEVVTLWQALYDEDSRWQIIWDSEYWLQAVTLAPYLGIDQRAELFSLLWGEDPALTDCYRRSAYQLQQLRHTRCVMAPLSILTDEDQSPTHKLLGLNSLSSHEPLVNVKLTGDEHCIMPLSLAELRFLTIEVLIPLSEPPTHGRFAQVDFLDLPDYDAEGEALSLMTTRLQQAKSQCLLQRYSEQQTMHSLLVCNAAKSHKEAEKVGQALASWGRQQQERGMLRYPGLIWVFTSHHQPQSRRYDHAVQRYVGAAGEAWGTLLAIDSNDTRRMIDYLATSAKDRNHHESLTWQINQIEQDLLRKQFGGWLCLEESDRAELAKQTVSTLQVRPTVQGELQRHLLPSYESLQQFYQQQSPREIPSEPTFDLFESLQPLTSFPSSDKHIQQLWINQLRYLPDNSALSTRLGIDSFTLATLVDELITASFRLGLWQQLEQALATTTALLGDRESQIERQITCALTVFGDFIRWLGFRDIPLEQRPASRINHGHPIFTAPIHLANTRLTALPAETANNTTVYIYDWLVALYTLIIENSGYHKAQDFSGIERKRLGRIIQDITAARTVIRHPGLVDRKK